MKFDFPGEDIMIVDNFEEVKPYDKPEQGSRWTLYFDGASNALGNSISAVLISLEGCHTPFNARLCFNCTNNVEEYEACIFVLTRLGNQILRCVWGLSFGHQSDQRRVGH